MKTGFLGILGGMGPLATADFRRKLAKKTPAEVDQAHIPVLRYGDCTTPDRTANLVAGGASPLPKLLDGIRFLNQHRVQAICVPCNSAHAWFEQMQAASDAPLLHIVRASAAQVRRKYPAASCVGVLSTVGTYRMGLYSRTLQDLGYRVVTPTEAEFETLVSPAIAMNKANRWAEAGAYYDRATQQLLDRGAEIIILGCTEIPFCMEQQVRLHPTVFVDSNDALVDAAIECFMPASTATTAQAGTALRITTR